VKLAVSETGVGPRTAVLIHGIMGNSRVWRRVTDDLVERGFRVLAVDLAGHGKSPRARRYSPTAWADDVVETVEPMLARQPEIVMGHSLGALVASLVADRLTPRSAIYIDPAFAFPRGPIGLVYKVGWLLSPRPGRSILVRMNPRWDAADIDLELQSLREWDRRTLFGFADTRPLVPPATLVAPSLVVLAEHSLLITVRAAEALTRLGMSVTTIPGTGHAVFRDDPAGFMKKVDEFLARTLPTLPVTTLPVTT
jgi:pimeloyl-ACP methyl ester carboxylesterase